MIFTMQDGKVITGLVIKTTPTTVEVVVNPLVKEPPVTLKLSDIDTKKASKISLMPKGLLDRLSAEEILDLVAYVASGGDEHNKLFSGGHDHHHAASK